MAMRKAEIAQGARKALREQINQYPGGTRIAGLKFGGGDQVISWIVEGVLLIKVLVDNRGAVIKVRRPSIRPYARSARASLSLSIPHR